MAKTYLWGMHAVTAALENPKRRVHTVITTEEGRQQLKRFRVPFDVQTRADLAPWAIKTAGGSVHQWVFATVDALPNLNVDDLPAGPLRILILDNVCDPQNIGALFRTAAATGFSYMIGVERAMPPLGGALAKVASGALEHVSVLLVPNLAQTIRKLKERDVWCVGLECGGEKTLAEAASFDRLALVLGQEGSGMRAQTKTLCDFSVALKTNPAFGVLNVANAGAIAMYNTAL